MLKMDLERRLMVQLLKESQDSLVHFLWFHSECNVVESILYISAGLGRIWEDFKRLGNAFGKDLEGFGKESDLDCDLQIFGQAPHGNLC